MLDTHRSLTMITHIVNYNLHVKVDTSVSDNVVYL